MNFLKINKTIFLLLAIVLLISLSHFKSFAVDNDIEVIKQSDIVLIKAYTSPPESSQELKAASFKLLKPYLNKKVFKISVIWQKDELSYGKIISISNVYIKTYLNRKLSTKRFIGLFQVRDLEPLPYNKNNIAKKETNVVAVGQIMKSSALREKANIFRLSEKYDSAIRIYQQSVDINPNDEISLFWMAEIYRLQKKYKLAEDYYTRTLEIDPEFKAADDALYDLRKSKS